MESLRDYLENQIPELYDSLKQAILERESTEEALSKQISADFAVV